MARYLLGLPSVAVGWRAAAGRARGPGESYSYNHSVRHGELAHQTLFHSADDSSLLSEIGSQEKGSGPPLGGRAAHLGKRDPARASSWDPFCQSLTRLRRSEMMAVRSIVFLS